MNSRNPSPCMNNEASSPNFSGAGLGGGEVEAMSSNKMSASRIKSAPRCSSRALTPSERVIRAHCGPRNEFLLLLPLPPLLLVFLSPFRGPHRRGRWCAQRRDSFFMRRFRRRPLSVRPRSSLTSVPGAAPRPAARVNFQRAPRGRAARIRADEARATPSASN